MTESPTLHRIKSLNFWARNLAVNPKYWAALHNVNEKEFDIISKLTHREIIERFAKWSHGVYSCETCNRHMENLLNDLQKHFNELIKMTIALNTLGVHRNYK